MAPSQVQLVDKPVGSIGYGLMGFTWRPKPAPQAQAFEAMDAALEQGANFWNGGELYGTPERNSMHLLNEYFTKYPEKAERVVLSVKGGMIPGQLKVDGGEKNVRRSVEECLRVLEGKKTIDLFECARQDPNVPIEDTVGALAQLVAEGKIGGISLSEVRASSIVRAAKVHPIGAVEVEVSLWATDILTNGVAATCAELNIPIVAYSPLCRGALVGERIRKTADIPEGDIKRMLPKFQDDVLDHNNKITDEVEKLAKKKGTTNAQIAIAWVKGLSGRKITTPDGKQITLGTIIPIPGATTKERVLENTKQVELTEEDMQEIAEILKQNPVKGERYNEAGMKMVEQ